MKLGIKSNRCAGWHQPRAVMPDGTVREGARWPSYQEAYDALVFFHREGKFPSEVEEVEVEIGVKSPGQVGYEGYRRASKGKSLATGVSIPEWDDLSPEIKAAWSAAAQAIISECRRS